MNLSFLVKQPVITEKSLKAASKGVFTFIVDSGATKDQITQAVTGQFGVDVLGVRTVTTAPKTYRTGRRRQLRHTTSGKKALVRLKPGQKIDLFDIEEK